MGEPITRERLVIPMGRGKGKWRRSNCLMGTVCFQVEKHSRTRGSESCPILWILLKCTLRMLKFNTSTSFYKMLFTDAQVLHNNSVGFSKHAIHKTKTHVVGSIVINPQGSFFTIVINGNHCCFQHPRLSSPPNFSYLYILCLPMSGFSQCFGSQVDILSL